METTNQPPWRRVLSILGHPVHLDVSLERVAVRHRGRGHCPACGTAVDYDVRYARGEPAIVVFQTPCRHVLDAVAEVAGGS